MKQRQAKKLVKYFGLGIYGNHKWQTVEKAYNTVRLEYRARCMQQAYGMILSGSRRLDYKEPIESMFLV